MNSEMMNVPRALLRRVVLGDASMGATAMQLVDAWQAMGELRALLAAPAAQPQGEPVAPDQLMAHDCGGVWAAQEFYIAGGCPKCGPNISEVERLHTEQIKALEALNDQSKKQRDHWMGECKKRDSLIARVVSSGALSPGQFEELEADCCAAVDVVHQVKKQEFRDHLKKCADARGVNENSCARCGAETVASCNDRGCGFFEAGNGAPVARLLHWVGPKNQRPHGGVCARTFAEYPIPAARGYWQEGELLYTVKP